MSYPIRENDIFRFCWLEKTDWGWDARYHCFEGFLRVTQAPDGTFILRDTYWYFDGRNGKFFTLDEAYKQGTLTFYFNVDDVDKIDKSESVYYKSTDIFTLSRQHACVASCVIYYKKRGALRDQDSMKAVIKSRLEDTERDIRCAERKRNRYIEQLTAVEAGNLEVYID